MSKIRKRFAVLIMKDTGNEMKSRGDACPKTNGDSRRQPKVEGWTDVLPNDDNSHYERKGCLELLDKRLPGKI